MEGKMLLWKESNFYGKKATSMKGKMLLWKESNYYGRKDASMEGKQLLWKESNFYGRKATSMEGKHREVTVRFFRVRVRWHEVLSLTVWKNGMPHFPQTTRGTLDIGKEECSCSQRG